MTIVTAEPNLDEASVPYLGRWQRLVSTTNWEKGQIVLQWRADLEADGRPAAEYSDEAWSRIAGGVSAQHVGRLRRVADRFGDSYESYQGLYWTHFLAALEWDDAELWLEGASQNKWSAPKMRNARWEANDADQAERDAAPAILDEEPEGDSDPALAGSAARVFDEEVSAVSDAEGEVDSANAAFDESAPWDDAPASDDEQPTLVQPFAGLDQLPADLDEAFETCRAAILRHKMGAWRDVSADTVLSHLDALKQLALAPSGD